VTAWSAPATAEELGLMQGSPPDADRLVTLANWQEGPYNRWAFQNVGAVVPSAAISRGGGPVLELPVELEDIGGLPLAEVPGTPTLDQFLRHSYTDAFLVLRDGRIGHEAYFNGMSPDSKHLLQSISKSFCGALAGTFVERGVLELGAPTRTYVPELWDSAYGDATVAQLLDMTASVRFSEEYADPRSEVQAQDRAAGWRPRRPDDPESSYAFLRTLRPDGRHGFQFQYCSATTDVLAWVLERATGRRYTDLLADELWSTIGAEHDAAITVDVAGFAFANGGLCVTARDLARFGQLMLHGGRIGRFRAAPPGWAQRHRRGGDPAPAVGTDFGAAYPRGWYSTKWWCTGEDDGTFYGVGIYGQFLWIVPEASLVVVKLSSLPRALDPHVTRSHHLAFRSLAASLVERAIPG
jgi:6-aminohexanoate-oligomer exohydrolase